MQEEIDDLTKDQRTVFVSQLVMKADERAVRKYFEKIGKVKQVIMIRDKYTNRHKGFSYVEMKDLDSIPLVLMVNNAVPDFQKFPILIKASEAEKNFLAKQETAAVAAATKAANAKDRIYVGNLHEIIGEDDLRTVLTPFGALESVQISRDPGGKSKGFAFVKFVHEADAESVLTKISAEGLVLMGMAIKVGPAKDAPDPIQNSADNWKLDDDGSNGLRIDAQSRLALMQRLGGGAGMPGMPQAPMLPMPGMPGMPMPGMPGMPMPGMPGAANPVSAVPAVPSVGGTRSFAIVIKNMFDPASETEEGWAADISEDTEQECSKFGKVLHCKVEDKKPGGLVYVLFRDTAGAAGAVGHMHGRWFAGRRITIDYLEPERYKALYPDAPVDQGQA